LNAGWSDGAQARDHCRDSTELSASVYKSDPPGRQNVLIGQVTTSIALESLGRVRASGRPVVRSVRDRIAVSMHALSDSIGKLFTAYLRSAEEGALSGLLVEITILHAASRQNAAQVLRDATTAYKVDVDAIRRAAFESVSITQSTVSHIQPTDAG
jgi:hypothetical protein